MHSSVNVMKSEPSTWRRLCNRRGRARRDEELEGVGHEPGDVGVLAPGLGEGFGREGKHARVDGVARKDQKKRKNARGGRAGRERVMGAGKAGAERWKYGAPGLSTAVCLQILTRPTAAPAWRLAGGRPFIGPRGSSATPERGPNEVVRLDVGGSPIADACRRRAWCV